MSFDTHDKPVPTRITSTESSRTGEEVGDTEVSMFGLGQNGHRHRSNAEWNGPVEVKAVSTRATEDHVLNTPEVMQGPMELEDADSLSTPHLDDLITFWMKEASDVRQPWMRPGTPPDDYSEDEPPAEATPGTAAAKMRTHVTNAMHPARHASGDRDMSDSSADELPREAAAPSKLAGPGGVDGAQEQARASSEDATEVGPDTGAFREGEGEKAKGICRNCAADAVKKGIRKGAPPLDLPQAAREPPGAAGHAAEAEAARVLELLQGKAEQAEELGTLLLRVSRLQRGLLGAADRGQASVAGVRSQPAELDPAPGSQGDAHHVYWDRDMPELGEGQLQSVRRNRSTDALSALGMEPSTPDAAKAPLRLPPVVATEEDEEGSGRHPAAFPRCPTAPPERVKDVLEELSEEAWSPQRVSPLGAAAEAKAAGAGGGVASPARSATEAAAHDPKGPPGAIHSTSRRRRSSQDDGQGRRLSSDLGEGAMFCRGSGPRGSPTVRQVGVYPFMESQYTLQRDILEDGRPPLPRMEVPERMMDMMMVVKDVSTLPKPAEGRSSFYCLEASFDNQIYKTQVKKGDEDFGCAWYERFEISVHELTMELAKTAIETGSEGPAVTFTCFDCGKYASTELVGKAVIFLQHIMQLPPEGGDVWTELLDFDGAPVSGNGEVSSLVVHFRLRSNAIQGKEVPTLVEVLSRSEGDIALSKAPVLSDASMEALKPRNRIGSLVSEESYFDAEDEAVAVGHSHINYYWRERLERVMNSLTVNLIIICCVLVDVINLLVMLITNNSSEDSLANVIITFTVQFVFLMELLLRIIASGFRFWRSWWNIFDFVVIWVSVIMVSTKFIIDELSDNSGWEDDDFEAANGTTNTLRVISRVAIGMRVIKVLINLRRARNLRGHVRQTLRTTVSQNKRRYKKHGFDLDLTYVTNRVIAMAAPAFGGHSAYRNDIHVVSRFLSYMHYGHFMVFNLCDVFHSGDRMMGSYHHKLLFSSVQRIPFEDHGPPLLGEMVYFCRQAEAWLRRDPKNVIAVHCKGGKGRSGLMIAAYLLWSGHRRCALDALELFTFRRTENYDPELGVDGTYNNFLTTEKCNQTVEGPSQIRYVHYLEAVLYCGISSTTQEKMYLSDISFPIGPMLARKPWMVSFTVRCNRACVFDSSKQDSVLWTLGGEAGSTCTFNLDLVVWGDVRIECYEHLRRWGRVKGKLKFFLVFNPAFYKKEEKLVFSKSKIDMLHKDRKKNKKCDADFSLTLNVSHEPSQNSPMRIEKQFRDIFRRCGTRHTYRRGEVVLAEAAGNHTLYLVVRGTVEGVVYEVPDLPAHMLGKYISDRKDEEEAAVNATSIRCPSVCVLGPNAVLGYSSFLSNENSMTFRAQTDVEVILLRKREQETKGGRNRRRVSLTGAGISDIEISDIADEDLADFYRGLATTLATRLSQVRKEMIRIGDLKGFSDSQGALIDHNLSEQLRASCTSLFALPMNEQVTFTIKCLCVRPSGRTQRMRLIVLTEYLILDPMFYGPEASAASEVIDVRQLRSVSPSDEQKPTTIMVTVLGPSVHGLDIAANVVNYTLTFVEPAQTMQVYHVISTMCKKAEDTRVQERFRPFETPFMMPLLESSSVAHHLKKGEELNLASNDLGASLFFIRSGEVRLRTSGRAMGAVSGGGVFRLVRQGACFGETEFALQLKHGHYWAEASEATVVLEMRQDKVHDLVQNDRILAARFHSTLCQVIEKQLRIALGNAFPGTWNRKVEKEYQHGTAVANPGSRRMRQSMEAGRLSRGSTDVGVRVSDDRHRTMAGSSWSSKGRLAQAVKTLMRSKSLSNGRAVANSKRGSHKPDADAASSSARTPRAGSPSPTTSSMQSASPATGSFLPWPSMSLGGAFSGNLLRRADTSDSLAPADSNRDLEDAVSPGSLPASAVSSVAPLGASGPRNPEDGTGDAPGAPRVTNWNGPIGRRALANPPPVVRPAVDEL